MRREQGFQKHIDSVNRLGASIVRNGRLRVDDHFLFMPDVLEGLATQGSSYDYHETILLWKQCESHINSMSTILETIPLHTLVYLPTILENVFSLPEEVGERGIVISTLTFIPHSFIRSFQTIYIALRDPQQPSHQPLNTRSTSHPAWARDPT